MKKIYLLPLTRVQTLQAEPLLNGASIVDRGGTKKDELGSDNNTGGTADGDGTAWGDAKPYNPWTSWD